jgi:hypothetical protein
MSPLDLLDLQRRAAVLFADLAERDLPPSDEQRHQRGQADRDDVAGLSCSSSDTDKVGRASTERACSRTSASASPIRSRHSAPLIPVSSCTLAESWPSIARSAATG